MTGSARARARVSMPVLLICAAAWMMFLVHHGTHAHRPVADSGALLDSFHMLLAMNPLSSLAAGWALMLVPMMSPPPIWTRFVSGLRTGLGASDPVGR